jgi:hypothetical protein
MASGSAALWRHRYLWSACCSQLQGLRETLPYRRLSCESLEHPLIRKRVVRLGSIPKNEVVEEGDPEELPGVHKPLGQHRRQSQHNVPYQKSSEEKKS